MSGQPVFWGTAFSLACDTLVQWLSLYSFGQVVKGILTALDYYAATEQGSAACSYGASPVLSMATALLCVATALLCVSYTHLYMAPHPPLVSATLITWLFKPSWIFCAIFFSVRQQQTHEGGT
jgi:hypothetical protein